MAAGHGADMPYILTATFLSEGDEGRRRDITSQKTDQGDTHESTGTHVSVPLHAVSVYLLSNGVKCRQKASHIRLSTMTQGPTLQHLSGPL